MVFKNVADRARFKIWLRGHMPSEMGKPLFRRVPKGNPNGKVSAEVKKFFSAQGSIGGKLSAHKRFQTPLPPELVGRVMPEK